VTYTLMWYQFLWSYL